MPFFVRDNPDSNHLLTGDRLPGKLDGGIDAVGNGKQKFSEGSRIKF